jgi:hypothetical protein
VVAGLLALIAAIVALAVVLNASGSGSRHPAGAAASAHGHHTAGGRHAGSSHPASHPSSSSTAGTGSATSGSASATTPAPASSTGSAATSGPAPPAAGSASARSPVGAVETFYGDAASHRYASAWALADPSLRSQLDGYRDFQAGQAGDRSITFNSAKVIRQSSQAATVAVQTTSVRDNGTQHCSGTVELVPAGTGGQWQLHQLHINCA